MIFASRIEALPTLGTAASAVHVLLDTEYVLASSTEHRPVVSLIFRPHGGLVSLTHIMAANAGIELLAAKVLDGDDV